MITKKESQQKQEKRSAFIDGGFAHTYITECLLEFPVLAKKVNLDVRKLYDSEEKKYYCGWKLGTIRTPVQKIEDRAYRDVHIESYFIINEYYYKETIYVTKADNVEISLDKQSLETTVGDLYWLFSRFSDIISSNSNRENVKKEVKKIFSKMLTGRVLSFYKSEGRIEWSG